jgi:TRAP-type mannitol/chloroaromatic compound transport system substrate-binding protein
MKNIKRVLVFCLIAIMATAVVGCGEAGNSGEGSSVDMDKVYTLKYQTYFGRAAGAELHDEVAEILENASGGRLKIEVYAAGEIVDSSSMLDAVETGVLDIGHGMGQYWAPVKMGPIEAGLPFSWVDLDEALVVYNELGLRELLEEEYDELGVRYLGPSFEEPYTIISKKPINSLDDMRKMKIRMLGAFANTAAGVGATGVNIPYEEIFLGITTGTIDGGLFGGANSYYLQQFHDITDYYLATPWVNPVTSTYIMNKESYDSLPADLQTIIDEVFYHWATRIRTQNMYGEYSYLENWTVTQLPNEDVKELTKSAMKVWEQEAAKSDRNKEAVEIIKKFNKLRGRLD